MKTKSILLSIIVILSSSVCNLYAQSKTKFVSKDIFQTSYFIENKGQFNGQIQSFVPIDFSTRSGSTDYYLSKNSLVIRLSKLVLKDESEEKEYELLSKNNSSTIEYEKKEEDEIKYMSVHQDIELHWLNTNTNPNIEKEEKSNHYFSYGNEEYISYGYKKITYKNLYPQIDLVYTIANEGGVKYSLVLHPGADINNIKYEYKGEDISLLQEKNQLIIKNEIEDLFEKNLVSFYDDERKIDITYGVNKNVVSFLSKQTLDYSRTITIDPWLGPITSLTSSNKGFDVDYDDAGNLYVYGGGDMPTGSDPFKIAKYNPSGILLWTFSGIIVTPPWSSGGLHNYAGNFVVNKQNGKIYIGQGIDYPASLVRLRTDGVYDAFSISMLAGQFEIWEMNYNCMTGNIINMGGSTDVFSSLGVIDTTTSTCTMQNITGFTFTDQDIVSSSFDPLGNLYVSMASLVDPNVDNHIMRLNASLTGVTWRTSTGLTSLVEPDNKQYFTTGFGGSNGFNCLAANTSYLFFYDGFNLAAFDNATGLPVGLPTTLLTYTAKSQGGIYADNCNHVFVGGANGNLHVFSFDGTNFIAESDINFAGYAGKAIYDIKYNLQNDLIYVSGNGIASIFASPFYCSGDTGLHITANGICPLDAYVSIDDYNVTTDYTFIWTDTLTDSLVRQIPNVHKSADTLFGLLPGHFYAITVIAKNSCIVKKAVQLISSNLVLTNTILTICPGDSVTYGGHTYHTAGVFEDTFNIGSCDSIARTSIRLFVGPSDTIYKTICSGDSFFCGGAYQKMPGIYADTFSSVSGGCDSNAYTVLQNYPINSFSVNDTNICLGHSAKLSVSGGLHYHWSNGDTTNFIIVSPNITTNYSVTVSDANNCPSSASATVSIFALGVTAEAIPDSIINSGESVWLHAIYAFVDTSLLWTPNNALSNIDSNYTLASPLETTTYAVIVKDSNGCQGIDSIQIVVINEGSIHVASAFSPNGDGHNDHFTVFAKGLVEFNISIFNRWGERVYFSEDLGELNNLDKGWDGTFKAKIQDVGTFVYYIKAKDLKNNSILTKGNFELLK